MRTQSLDTGFEAEEVLVQGIRKMPEWRRLQLALELSDFARQLTLAGLENRYPDASKAEIRRRFADLHLGAELAAEVYGPAEYR